MSDRESYEGVVVLGFPRSGTTLLRRLLDAHPALCCPPETFVLNACGRFLLGEEITGGLTLGVLGGLAFSGIDTDEVIRRLRELAFGFFRDICRASGKRRWVERTPADMFQLDGVERICGNHCRYICIVRHPLDVVCSTKELCDELEVFPPELYPYVQRYPAQLEAFAHAWVETHSRLLSFMKAHRDGCVRVRYEELVADPIHEIDRVFKFLGEPTDAEAVVQRAMASKAGIGIGDWKTYEKVRITKDSVGRWHDLTPRRLARLAAIVNPLLGDFGYPAVVVEGSVDPEKARHLYQMRLWVAKLKSEVTAARGDSAGKPRDRTVAGEGQEHGS
jgi:protein-tyrosine sulfotransferase